MKFRQINILRSPPRKRGPSLCEIGELGLWVPAPVLTKAGMRGNERSAHYGLWQNEANNSIWQNETKRRSLITHATRPHTCATVYMVNDTSGWRRCARQSASASVSSRSDKSPRRTIVPASDCTVDGR
jgi:hypothetical protein